MTATSSTATSIERPRKFITSKPRTTVAFIKSPRNITFRSRKLPPKMSFINITTPTAFTGETTGYNTGDVNITTLPVLNNSTQESTLKKELIVALSTTIAAVFLSVAIYVCNLCVCVRYDRLCGLCSTAICVCRKISDSNLQRVRFPTNRERIRFPTNRDVETLSADSLELFSLPLHEKSEWNI